MKTIRRKLRTAAIALVAGATLTSCLEEKEPSFNVTMTGYIWQTQVQASQRFDPVLWITSDNIAYPLESVTMTCSKNSIEFFSPSEKNDFVMVSNGNFATIEELDNTYEITAVARDGHMVQSEFRFGLKATDTIPPVTVSDITYNKGLLTFTLNELENCGAVGILVTPYSRTTSPRRTNAVYQIITAGAPEFTDGKREFKYALNLETLLASFGEGLDEQCKVNVFVANKGLARESNAEQTFLKGKSTFE